MLAFVIPGRAEGANPESRKPKSRGFWIPGPPPSKSAVADLDNIDADLA
jgi:hypothetical protein